MAVPKAPPFNGYPRGRAPRSDDRPYTNHDEGFKRSTVPADAPRSLRDLPAHLRKPLKPPTARRGVES